MTTDSSDVGELSHRTARNTAIRGVSEILGKVATLAWTALAARILTREEFGTVSYALNVMLLVSALAAWGFDAGVMQKGSADPKSLPRVYVSSQLWKTGLSVLVFGVTLVLVVGQKASGPWPIVLCMLLAGFPELWSLTARAASAARQRPGGVSSALIAQRLLTALLIVAALLIGLGPVGVAVGFLLGTLLGWGLHHRALHRLGVRQSLRELTRSDFANAVSGTFFIGLSGLVLMLLFRIDVVLLGSLKGPDEVAVYSVAYRLLETVLFVTYAINHAVFPVMSASPSMTRRTLGYQRALSVAAFVYLPFLAVCLFEGEAIINLLFGSQYATEAAPVLALLAPAPLFLGAAFFGNSVLASSGRTRTMVAASLMALVVNTVLNFALIPPFGGAGAAVATTVAYTLQAGAILLAARRIGVRPHLPKALASAFAAALVLVAVLVLLHLPLLLELAVGGVVYVGVWLAVVSRVSPEQRDIVVGLVKRRAGR